MRLGTLDLEEKYRKPLLAVLMAGVFVAILNQTLLATALPHIMRDLDITANTAQWLTTVFMLVNGVMISITAFLINKYTTRHLFFAAMGLFAAIPAVIAFNRFSYSVERLESRYDGFMEEFSNLLNRQVHN